MNSRHERERGVALIASLMILMVISLIGVVALRSSAFSGKVAMGVQLDSMLFEGAESAISDTLFNLVLLNDSNADEIVRLLNDETITWCMLESGGRNGGSCGNSDYMDSRKMLRVESRTQSTGYKPVSGNQISTTGSSGIMFADFELSIQADAKLVDFGNMENRHVQQALRRGMISAKEIE